MAICLAIGLVGCQSEDLRNESRQECAELEQRINLPERIETLNLLGDAFAKDCYDTVITYGAQARSEFRHKTFSVLKETASIFVPDGTFIDYVLESYERGFLSLLLAASYLHAQKVEEAKVELRQLDHELFTPLYNYGEDPVNILLSAVLWEQLGERSEARVDWLRLRDLGILYKGQEKRIRLFADRQVDSIDRGERPQSGWRVYGVGRFPDLEWDLQFFGSTTGYFAVKAKEEFLPVCVSETGVRLSTRSWFEKVAMRHSHAYHPLLNVQTWIRLPIGITYGLVPLAAGAGVLVGGCMIDAAGGGRGALCQVSMIGGIALMSTAPRVLEGALRPDLRHWERVPAAFVATRASAPHLERCFPSKESVVQRFS